MPTVFIPTALRGLSGGVAAVDTAAGSVADVVAQLESRFPGIRDAIIEEDRMRPGVLASIDGETTTWLLERVPEHSELHFVLAISGG
jgi:molybdopterin synthase sulfur carrier subunit